MQASVSLTSEQLGIFLKKIHLKYKECCFTLCVGLTEKLAFCNVKLLWLYMTKNRVYKEKTFT